MQQIKTLIASGDLQQANYHLATLLSDRSVIDKAMATISDDHQFWRHIFDNHEFRIVADGTDMEQIIAPRYVNVMSGSFFVNKIDTIDDVLRYSIHGGAHHKCELLWKQCPVPMSTFDSDYLAWIEDIYGQRFVHQTAPSWHQDMYITALYYFEFHDKQPNTYQRDVINMLRLGQEIKIPALDTIHSWLYAQNALDQSTFNSYMQLWATLCTAHAEFRRTLDLAFHM